MGDMGDTEKEMAMKIHARESTGAVWAQKRDASSLQKRLKESLYSASNDIWTETWRMKRNWQQSAPSRWNIYLNQRCVWGVMELMGRVCRLVIKIKYSSYPARTEYHYCAKWMLYNISYDPHSVPQMRRLRRREVTCFAHDCTIGKWWSQKLMHTWLASQPIQF